MSESEDDAPPDTSGGPALERRLRSPGPPVEAEAEAQEEEEEPEAQGGGAAAAEGSKKKRKWWQLFCLAVFIILGTSLTIYFLTGIVAPN